jgi:hypothetical protein
MKNLQNEATFLSSVIRLLTPDTCFVEKED